MPSQRRSCSLYVPTARRAAKLSLCHTQPPDETDAERTARQFRMLRQVADYAMHLTAQAAERASQAQTPPQPEPDAKPAPARQPDPILAFTRLAHAVRCTVALEIRVAAECRATYRRQRLPSMDTRRPTVRHPLQDLVADHPDRRRLRRDIDDSLDDALDADPGAAKSVWTLFFDICCEFGLEPDISKLSDELLMVAGPDPPEAEAVLF